MKCLGFDTVRERRMLVYEIAETSRSGGIVYAVKRQHPCIMVSLTSSQTQLTIEHEKCEGAPQNRALGGASAGASSKVDQVQGCRVLEFETESYVATVPEVRGGQGDHVSV